MKSGMNQRRGQRWLVALAAVALAAILIAWNWQALMIWATMVPQTKPLPTFDASKAQRLSAERRAELERELFSELWMWNTWSRRYQAPNGLAERRQRWVAMAEEGYELAYLTLQVLEPGDHVHNPLPVLKRLDELARQGDTGAMCLYGNIVFQMPVRRVDWTPQHKPAREWMEKGAALGHPQCLVTVGGWKVSGYIPPKDLNGGMRMVFEGLRKGYDHGVGSLWLLARDLKFADAASRQLEYCWSYQDSQSSYYPPDLSIEAFINRAPPEQRPALERELNQLRQWHPSTEDCIELTQQTFGE